MVASMAIHGSCARSGADNPTTVGSQGPNLTNRVPRIAKATTVAMYSLMKPIEKSSRSKGFRPNAEAGNPDAPASSSEPATEIIPAENKIERAEAAAESSAQGKNGTQAVSKVAQAYHAVLNGKSSIDETTVEMKENISGFLKPAQGAAISGDTPNNEIISAESNSKIAKVLDDDVPSKSTETHQTNGIGSQRQISSHAASANSTPHAPPRTQHKQDTVVYREGGFLKEATTKKTPIQKKLEAAKQQVLDEIKAGKNSGTGSPENLRLARRTPDAGDPSTEHTKRISITVDDVKTAFPYIEATKEDESNGKHCSAEPPKHGKAIVSSSSKWVKERDLKPLYNNGDTGSNAWGSEVPKGFRRSFDSVNADQDLGEDDHNDVGPNQHHALADWSGKMAPAPVEWDSRVVYDNHSRQHEQYVGCWVSKHALLEYPILDLHDPRFIDYEDLDKGGYVVNTMTNELEPPPYLPQAVRDWSDTLTAAHAEEVTQTLVDNWVANTRKDIDKEEEEKKHRRRERWRVHNEYQPGPNPYSPTANIYLRPAERRNLKDLEQIRDIWNGFIENSCSVIETQPKTIDAIAHAIQLSTEVDQLPYIVAVLRNPGQLDKNCKEAEKIVGFSWALGLGYDRKDAYRYTVELNLFVHPDHRRKGVGRCLMDMMMCVLDKYYIPRKGYLFDIDDSINHNYVPGGNRYGTKKICMVMPHDANDPTEYEMMKQWVGREWEFEEEAMLKGHGYKFTGPTKLLNVGYLVRFTKHSFNMAAVL